jgi:hypothetical protein
VGNVHRRYLCALWPGNDGHHLTRCVHVYSAWAAPDCMGDLLVRTGRDQGRCTLAWCTVAKAVHCINHDAVVVYISRARYTAATDGDTIHHSVIHWLASSGRRGDCAKSGHVLVRLNLAHSCVLRWMYTELLAKRAPWPMLTKAFLDCGLTNELQ